MTQFQEKTFSVGTHTKAPPDCKHGWLQPKTGRCVLCGERAELRTIMVETGAPSYDGIRCSPFNLYCSEGE